METKATASTPMRPASRSRTIETSRPATHRHRAGGPDPVGDVEASCQPGDQAEHEAAEGRRDETAPQDPFAEFHARAPKTSRFDHAPPTGNPHAVSQKKTRPACAGRVPFQPIYVRPPYAARKAACVTSSAAAGAVPGPAVGDHDRPAATPAAAPATTTPTAVPATAPTGAHDDTAAAAIPAATAAVPATAAPPSRC